jgi:hypothetical protein
MKIKEVQILEISKSSPTKREIDEQADPIGMSQSTQLALLCVQIDKLKDRLRELEKCNHAMCVSEESATEAREIADRLTANQPLIDAIKTLSSNGMSRREIQDGINKVFKKLVTPRS